MLPVLKWVELSAWAKICLVRNWIPDLCPVFPNEPYKEREILPHRISLQSLEKSITLWVYLANMPTPDSACSSQELFGNSAGSLNRYESSYFITGTCFLKGGAEPQHIDQLGHNPQGPRLLAEMASLLCISDFPSNPPPSSSHNAPCLLAGWAWSLSDEDKVFHWWLEREPK